MRGLHVAAYCRVSSKAQDFATQRSAMERAASARGDTITSWRSEKRRGKLLARPELVNCEPMPAPDSSASSSSTASTV